jgi:hypothetical protein
MSQSFTNLLYHIICSTKDRQPLITSAYEPRLYEYIGGIIKGTGGVSLGINGDEDHMHVWPSVVRIVLCPMFCAISNAMQAAGCMRSFPRSESFRGSVATAPLP